MRVGNQGSTWPREASPIAVQGGTPVLTFQPGRPYTWRSGALVGRTRGLPASCRRRTTLLAEPIPPYRPGTIASAAALQAPTSGQTRSSKDSRPCRPASKYPARPWGTLSSSAPWPRSARFSFCYWTRSSSPIRIVIALARSPDPMGQINVQPGQGAPYRAPRRRRGPCGSEACLRHEHVDVDSGPAKGSNAPRQKPGAAINRPLLAVSRPARISRPERSVSTTV